MTTAIRFRSVLVMGVAATLFGVAAQAAPANAPPADPAMAGPGPLMEADRFPIDIAAAETRAGERFAKIDADGDGRLTREELQAAGGLAGERPWRGGRGGPGSHGEDASDMLGGGMMGERLARLDPAIFQRLDSDGNGALSETEFSMQRVHEAAKAEVQGAVFARLDANGDGALTREELPDPARRLRRLDDNGDGLVSAEEAAGWRKHRANRRGGGS